MQGDKDSLFLSKIIFSEDQTFCTLSEEAVRELFLHDADEKNLVKALPKFAIKQATQPFMAPAKLSEANFGSVSKHYIRASLDRILPLPLQDQMISNWKVDKVSTLASGHSPEISMPNELAELIRQ